MARRPRKSPRQREREEEEQRKDREECRAKAGIPGPVDNWLSDKLAQGVRAGVDFPLAADEVQCEVFIERIPHPDPDWFFADYDTLVLRLTVTSPSRDFGEGALQSETHVVLGTYDDDPEMWMAPDWVQHPVGTVAVFRDTAAAVSDLIQRVAPPSDGMTVLANSLAAVRLDG
ncbi:hypothetical protein C8Q78DRAFT_1071760 [Trametes maxima]|nr:hypothetical protein C8Q78DRAFT_1071760 [Trametes maxima]